MRWLFEWFMRNIRRDPILPGLVGMPGENGWSAEMPGGGWIGFAYKMVGKGRNAVPTDDIFVFEKEGGGCLGTCPWKHVATLTGKNSYQVLDDYYSGRYSPPVAAPPVDPLAAYTPIVTDPRVADTGDDTFSLGEEGYNSPSGPYSLIKPEIKNSPEYQEFPDEWIKNQQDAIHARDTGKVGTTDLTGKKTYNLPGNNYDTAPSLMPPGTGNSVSGVPLQLGWRSGGKTKRKRRRNKKTRRNSRRKTKRRR